MGKFHDSLNLLSSFRLKRIKNALLILFSFYYSRLLKKPRPLGLPVSISFEPTTSCNLRCPECPSGLRSFTRPTGMLDTRLFENVINQMKDHLAYLTFYFQGEPYLHPDFLSMVRLAKAHKIYTATSTNAHYLNEENAKKTVESGLSRLIISIDGTTQDTYQSYRVGGRLTKVLEGTKNIIKWKKELKSPTPHVIFQFLVVKHNEHQIGEIHALARELGVDEVRLKTAQIYDYENGSSLMPDNPRYSRYYKDASGKYKIKNSLDDGCWKMWHSCVITWDGKVVPCCFDKDAHHQLGTLQNQTFKDVWFGTPYNSFREQLFKSRSQIEMCKNCTEGTKVWA